MDSERWPVVSFAVASLKFVGLRIAWLLREFFSLPIRIVSWGGWPKYVFIFMHVVIGLKIVYDVTSFVGSLVAPAPRIPPLDPNYSLQYIRDYADPRAPAALLTKETEERVRKELTKTSAYCAQLNAEQQSWCEHMIGHDLLSMYNAYRGGREASCEWHEETNFQLKTYVLDEDAYYNYTPSPKMPNYDVTWPLFSGAVRGPWNAELGEHGLPYVDYQWGTYDHGKVLKSCKFPGKPKERGHWYVNKVGPFTGRNKGSWHFIWFHAFARWEREFELPGAIGRSMTASLASYSDKDGNIIGYPPLHMHHFHVFQVNPLAPFWPHTVFTDFETHGDDMCSHEGLGAACYMKVFPPGFGSQVVPRYFADSLANFVADQDDEEFWVEVSMLVTDDKTLDVERTVPFVPMIPGMHGTMPALAGTYVVPKRTDSLVWVTLQLPYSMEFLWWKWHTHYYYTNEIWFVEGDGREIFGLDEDPYVLRTKPFTKADVSDARRDPTGDPMKEFHGNIPEYVDARFPIPTQWELALTERYLDLADTPLKDMDTAKADLLARHRAYNARQLASGAETAGFLYRIADVDEFHSEVGGRMWTHRPLTKPGRSAFKKGEKITIIVFHRNTPYLCGDTCDESKQPIRQHVIDVITGRPTDPDLKFFLSPSGTRFLYYTKYHPFWVAALVLSFLAPVLYLAASLYWRGKCAPTLGPCARTHYKIYSKLRSEDDEDVEATATLVVEPTKNAHPTAANAHRAE